MAGSGARRRARVSTLLVFSLFAALMVVMPSFAAHPTSSLAGSNFEIDDDANLKVDHASPSLDWANVTFIRKDDKPTGKDDDSYSGGVKEDTVCPGETTGGIPNNKSDLLSFGVYEEAGAPGSAGFLHLFWTRVNEPNGATLMDFEFNQSATKCPSGPNNLRTTGDILLEYAIDQGGSRATISMRRWTGSAWGAATTLDENDATGTINSSSIPAAESANLISSGSLSPRTFGEASINLNAIFDPDKCESFGSAMLKSRASFSFTSQLKDFIAPVPITLTNCGAVTIRKVTSPASQDVTFGFTKDFGTDPSTTDTFTLTGVAGSNVKSYAGVLFGTGYTVTEDDVPANWAFTSVDCSAGNVTPTSIVGATVTFDISEPSDHLDCTYTNTRLRGSLVVHKVDGTDGPLLGGAGFTITAGPGSPIEMTETGTEGIFCADELDFANTYTVTETTVPDGYIGGAPATGLVVDSASDCSDAETRSPDATFVNNPAPGTINVLKVDDDDPPNPLEGAGFTVYVDAVPVGIFDPAIDTAVAKDEQLTGADGTTSFTDVPLGTYCVVETTTPAGHETADPQCGIVVGLGDEPGEGQTINLTFVDVRQHKVIVIVCHEGTNTLAESTVTNGDGTMQTLPPGSANEGLLCGLSGFSGKSHGDKALTVDVGSDAH